MSDEVPRSAGQRSRVMSTIRKKHTKPEMRVRKALFAAGLRYRLHRRDLPGTPDIVFPRDRLAIFVHGCFWHQHEGCRYCKKPRTNTDYWGPKLERNVERDRENEEQLREDGWRVLVVWECDTETPQDIDRVAANVRTLLRQTDCTSGRRGNLLSE